MTSDTETDSTPTINSSAFQRQALLDLCRRGVPTGHAYIALAVVAALATEMPTRHPAITASLLLLMIFGGFYRRWLSQTFPSMLEHQPQLWMKLYAAIVIVSSIAWGTFAAIALNTFGLEWTSMLMIMLTVGASSSGTTSLTPNFRLLFTFLVCMIMPLLISAMAMNSALGVALSFSIFVYAVVIGFNGFQLHRDYRTSVEAQFQLQQRSSELSATLQKLEQYSQQKSQFFANLSHEIRTPISGVLGMLDILGKTPLQGQQQDYIRTAKRSAEALLAIINSVLDYSKIEAGKLRFESLETPIEQLLEDCLTTAQARIQQKQLEVGCIVEPELTTHHFRCDPTRLTQIINNLLSNAIKFTDQGNVVVHAMLKEASELLLRIEIRDTGIGIAQENREKLFESYSQAEDSTTRHYGGTGLGLAICKQIIEQQGGRIDFSSHVGQGTVFWFELPVSRGRDIQLPPQVFAPDEVLLLVTQSSTVKTLISHFASQASLAVAHEAQFSQISDMIDQLIAGDQTMVALLVDEATITADQKENWYKKLVEELPQLPIICINRQNRNFSEQIGYLQFPLTFNVFSNALKRANTLQPAPVEKTEFTQSNNASTQSVASQSLPRKRVLVVDDNEINRKVAQGILTRFGFDIDLAEDGAEAVDMVQQIAYDLVLMDIHMPNMDGIEATRRIRALPKSCANVPIVAMTASVFPEERHHCFEAGMIDFFTKPINVSLLKSRLEKWLEYPVADHQFIRASQNETPLNKSIIAELQHSLGAQLPDLFRIFMHDAPERLESMHTYLASNDLDSLRRAAHTLKGGCATFGAHDLSEMCENLCLACRDNTDSAELALLVSEIETEFARVAEAIEAELENLTAH